MIRLVLTPSMNQSGDLLDPDQPGNVDDALNNYKSTFAIKLLSLVHELMVGVLYPRMPGWRISGENYPNLIPEELIAHSPINRHNYPQLLTVTTCDALSILHHPSCTEVPYWYALSRSDELLHIVSISASALDYFEVVNRLRSTRVVAHHLSAFLELLVTGVSTDRIGGYGLKQSLTLWYCL